MTFTHALSTNNYGEAKFIVASSAANGTHTTLAAAMAAASVGDTILLRDSVTENVTITPGVNIRGLSGARGTSTVSITGKLSMTGAGTSTISNIDLITNSDFCVDITGSAASILNLNNCYINCTNNTGISFTSSNASATLNIYNCYGDLGTTGIALLSQSSAGTSNIYFCSFTNTGLSTTANTFSGGLSTISFTEFFNPITTSGSTAAINFRNTLIRSDKGVNVTAFTHGSTSALASAMNYCTLSAGTAVAITISAGATLNADYVTILSTNASPVTGAGAINFSNFTFTPASTIVINTTTQSGGAAQGITNSSPAAGFLGEQIRSAATAVALTTTTPANIASISLTPGVWDISCVFRGISSTLSITTCVCGISTNTGSFTGTVTGDSQVTMNSSAILAITYSMAIPNFRALVTTTTTYYLVGQVNAGGTVTGDGRISAVRVG